MRVVYLDLGMGAAGDMLTAALYELLDDDGKRSFIDKINSLGIEGVSVCAVNSVKCGISGTHMEVIVDGLPEDEHHHDHGHHHDDEHHHHHDHDHEHHHDHEHQHDHHHTGMDEIKSIFSSMNVSQNVRDNAIKVYDIIAGAESLAHGTDVSLVHFHEVGAKDAITDVTAVCLLMEMLGAEKVIASPVCIGSGKVRCAHGILPVPAPATANILTGIPIYAGDIEGELCTPTGAALVKFFVDEFSGMPVMIPERYGYGMGSKDFKCANCVRAVLGETQSIAGDVAELSCNVDDMTGEAVGYATQKLFEEGARDVYTIPLGMKKSRPGVMINVICDADDEERFASLMFKYTSTIGVRVRSCSRYTLKRWSEYVETPFGTVTVKISEGYGVKRIKPEYDDLCRMADNGSMTIDEASDIILRQHNEE